MTWNPSGMRQRQPRALVVGLRRIVKDPKATVAQRLRACELLAIIAGYTEGRFQDRVPIKAEISPETKEAAPVHVSSPANAEKLKRLLEKSRSQSEAKDYLARSEPVPTT